jgi:hypothetical protein
MKRFAIPLLALVFSLACREAFALACTSQGATWNTAGNWSCGRVPTTADTVTINTNMAVNVNTANVLSITINSGFTLTQNTNTMQTAGALAINGTGVLSSGNTLTVTGTTTVNGTLNLTAGAKTFTGAVTVNGTWNNSGNLAVGFGNNLANNGTFTSGTNTQTFSLASPGPTLSGSNAITFSGAVTATNGLTINMGAAATTVTLNGATTVGAGGGLTITQGTLTSSANLTVSGATSISGTFNITGGATHTHTGAVTINNGGVWNNSGNTVQSFGNNLTNSSGGTFTSGTGTTTFTATTTVTGTAPITFSGTTNFNVNLVVAAGTVNFANATTVTGTTGVTGTLGITNATGAKTFTGAVTINNGGVWNNSAGDAISFGNNLTNNGGFTSGSGTQSFTAATATLSGANGITFGGAVTVTNALVINMGAAATTVTLNGASSVGTTLTITQGTLTSAANLTVTGTTSITGTFNITGGATHTHTGTVTINAGGTWNNSGNAPVSLGASLTNNGSFTSGSGSLTFTAATATLTGAFTFDGNVTANGNLALANNATVANNAAALVTGNLTGGNGGSTWTNNANSSLEAHGSLLTTGTLSAAANPNLVWYNVNAAQAVKLPTDNYYNLQLSGGNTKTPTAGTYSILNDFTIDSGVTFNANASDPTISVGGNLTLDGSYTASNNAARSTSVTGEFKITGTYTGNAAPVNLSGDFTQSGTFNSSTGLVSFLGGNAATFGGTAATSITNLTINKSAGIDVTIACGTPSPTVTGTLTLTSGNIVTSGSSPGCATDCASQVPIIVSSAGTLSGGSSSSYVQGAFSKGFAAAGALSYRAAGSDEFPIGTARISGNARYSPIEVSAGTTSTAGTVTACATAAQNPNMTQAAGGGIDTSKDAARYWSMTTSGINTTAALMDAIFKFVTASPSDVIGGANTANFIVERWDGVDWNPTTLNAAGATSTRVTGVDITGATNDFAIGEPLASFPTAPGAYNAFDTTAAANAVLGVIQTKQVGTSFSVRVVRLLNNAVDTTFNTSGIQVQLVDSSNNTGTFTTGCKPNWTTQIGTVNVNFALGVATATFPAAQIPNVYKDVRVRIGGGAGCSNDNFAIRPTSLTVDATDATWQTAGSARSATPLTNASAAGGVVHAASETGGTTRAFTLRATPQAAGGQSASRYDGSPTVVAGYPFCCTPSTSPACSTLPTSCTSGTLTFTDTSWNGTGARANDTAEYSEAGVLNLRLEDQSFAAVDASDGSSLATRTVPATATASIGRFVPDHFVFASPSTPTLQTFGSGCASRSFTYVGQPFWYATTYPGAVLQAVNSKGNVTTNYRGSLFKLANTDLTETYSNNSVGPAIGCKLSSSLTTACTSANAPPSLSAPSGVAPPIGGNGTADYSAATSGSVLVYTRDSATPIVPYTASVSLSVSATDASESSVSGNPGNGLTPTLTASSALVFNGGGSGIAFDAGAEFRYGRMRLLNGAGSLTVDIPVTLRAEYYASVLTGFSTNTSDNCTSFTAQNFALTGHQSNTSGSITTANMVSPTAGSPGNVSVSGSLAAGVLTSLKLLKPTGSVTQPGSVKICVDLDTASGVGACQAVTPSAKSYLQGPWSGATYDADPTAQVNFGFFGAQPKNFLFFRENY